MWLFERHRNVYGWQWVLFGLSMAIITIVLIINFTSPRLDSFLGDFSDQCTWISKEKLLNEVQTGDVLLFEGDTYGERVMKWCTDSFFSHVSLVIRITNDQETKVYLWEADLGQRKKEGPRLIELSEKFQRYRGNKVCGWRQLKGPSIDPRRFVPLIDKYLSFEMDHRVLTWWFSGWFTLFYPLFKTENKVFCSEFVALTLQELGIMKKDRLPSWYSPGDFYRNTDLSLEKGYSYGPIRFCRFQETSQ